MSNDNQKTTTETPACSGSDEAPLLSVAQQYEAVKIMYKVSNVLCDEKDDGVTFNGTLAKAEAMLDDFLFGLNR